MKERVGKTRFFCGECGFESPKWMGKCPGCGKWSTFVEEKAVSKKGKRRESFDKPRSIKEIEVDREIKFSTGIGEFDRVLGGGVVPGSVVLVGGDPGIGKSTLLIQVSDNLARKGGLVLYVSGEESARQMKLRTNRLGSSTANLYIVAETNFDLIAKYIEELKPRAVVIDSIQTIYCEDIGAAPGSLSQVKESTAQLIHLAKKKELPVFIVGHVTKEGAIAGPRVLEHMVDTVLYFEGEEHYAYRVLRAVKNRFGSTDEIGIFQMQEKGLVEVLNPSEMFLSERPKGVPGSVVTSSIEGTRPLLVELQALVNPSNFGMPQRRATGVDYNRVSLLLAVLEKRAGLPLRNQDVFVNVAGGVKVEEPAVDLGIVVAIASSFKNIPADPETVVVGEVGLAGEVRGVSQVAKRIKEASKLGFKRSLIPEANLKGLGNLEKIEIKGVKRMEEALQLLLKL
jgi:DNA repair protein RadA/Sms